jgi:hypothetical protein
MAVQGYAADAFSTRGCQAICLMNVLVAAGLLASASRERLCGQIVRLFLLAQQPLEKDSASRKWREVGLPASVRVGADGITEPTRLLEPWRIG